MGIEPISGIKKIVRSDSLLSGGDSNRRSSLRHVYPEKPCDVGRFRRGHFKKTSAQRSLLLCDSSHRPAENERFRRPLKTQRDLQFESPLLQQRVSANRLKRVKVPHFGAAQRGTSRARKLVRIAVLALLALPLACYWAKVSSTH